MLPWTGLRCNEQGPPVPPGEPTALNKEAGRTMRRSASARGQNRERKTLLVTLNRDSVRQ